MPGPDLITLQLQQLFPSVDQATILDLSQRLPEVGLKKGEVLFYQNDPAESMYLIVAGKLGAYLCEPPEDNIFIGTMGPGETVGENGLITQRPRGLTIKALTDCKLLELSLEDFEAFYQKYPGNVLDITQLVIRRYQQTMTKITNTQPSRRRVLFVTAKQTPVTQHFIDKMKKRTQALQEIEFFNTSDINNLYDDEDKVLQWVESQKARGPLSLFFTDISHPMLKCSYEGLYDAVVWVVDNTLDAEVAGAQWQEVTRTVFPYKFRKEILILHAEHTMLAPAAQGWIEQDEFDLRHHVRVNEPADYERLLRFLAGKAVGLVLSGGGYKGWVHVGAMRAILEHNIPIDAIGGTSIGAAVAGSYAATANAEDFEQMCYALWMSELNPFALWNLAIPYVSILNAKRGTNILIDQFGETRIEELMLPIFCVACNLNQSAETVWQQGLLWKKIRGSMSLPGVVPPMVENGHMYVDGGVVNNLPVDAMRKLLWPEGVVIAVDLSVNEVDDRQYQFPPVLTFYESLKAFLNIKRDRYQFPHFGDMMLKSLLMGSSNRTLDNRLRADFLIRPDLEKIGRIRIQNGQRLIEPGYRCALNVLADWDPARIQIR